jgi:hypothetical protein
VHFAAMANAVDGVGATHQPLMLPGQERSHPLLLLGLGVEERASDVITRAARQGKPSSTERVWRYMLPRQVAGFYGLDGKEASET